MPHTIPVIDTSKMDRSELKEFGSHCLCSFLFSAFATLIVCALTPSKPVEEQASPFGAMTVIQ